MLRIVSVTFLLTWLSFSSAQAQTRTAKQPSASAEVEATLTRFSQALATANRDTFGKLVTPEFSLLDEGRVYNLASAIESVQSVLSTGSMIRTPQNFRTTVRGSVAWSHYEVTGEFRGPDGVIALKLIEAAVLERAPSGWQMALMTTLPQAGLSKG
jgi:Domain of unknown function (DUF4440)